MELVDTQEDITPQKRFQDNNSDDSQDNKKKRPGRKLITTEASSKRTAQNRAAQRAFRDRKQQYLKDLEDQVRELTEQRERTERENQKLKSCVDKLKQENVTLKGGNFTYESSPVDFDKAMADLFDTPSSAANIDLKSTYDLQQVAIQGTDLTKPGAVTTIRPAQMSSRSANSASPQSVPNMYPNFDLTSATSAALTSSLSSQQNSAFSSLMTTSTPFMGTGSQSSMTDGLSNDILNGIQLLASNQNISTGSFLDNLLDTSSANGSYSKASISPPLASADRRSSTLGSSGYATNELGTSRSPSVSTSAATPGDMYVPLNTLPSNSSAGALFGLDTLKGQQPTDFAQLAALLQQSQQPALDGSQTLAAAGTTPAFSELFSLSPSSAMTDGLISMVSSSTSNQQGLASNAIIANGSGATSMAGISTLTASSLPQFMQQQPQQQQLDASTYKMSQMAGFPSHLMAYRNPDPMSLAEDSDQLEKLLLDSMYPPTGHNANSSAAELSTLATQNNIVAGLPAPASNASSTASAGASSSKSSDATAVKETDADQQPMQHGDKLLECTCRNCDSSPCAPCPKHGSPGDMSEELRGIAPEMLSYVCTSTNTLANEELDDLCSLMYKHAKCSEVQQRVQQVREKLKTESNLEMINTKKKLAKQYGLM
ncbi:DNA-binding transcription factor yap1 [Coemansia sp. RSA 1813]|nr:DNA-binding transcription factor yap1 [Coemansia sp. RSA 1646]KAJ1770404.1 DNA-binding transcription factor yap1 [Coemansia sp. RSA 1843]KAJ2088220.1 DNA-binding transcription factor yap1 [Coemansia sp. RSA 986]KAJ2215737.1 DNA-binding transcription factor yap1 [Coemansia sp. RSA 487]KAJ2566927.1 DNA-binding transcription factor yap1 [Coemansia sp. RSA 1813]